MGLGATRNSSAGPPSIASTPSFLLPHDLLRPFVPAETQVGRMAHFSGLGPFREFDLGHEPGLDPCGQGLVLHALPERRGVRPQRPELLVQVFQRGVVEARPDMADVAPDPAVSDRKDQGAEKWPRPARRGEAHNYGFLPARGLDLQPIRASLTRTIGAIGALGHDALKATPLD